MANATLGVSSTRRCDGVGHDGPDYDLDRGDPDRDHDGVDLAHARHAARDHAVGRAAHGAARDHVVDRDHVYDPDDDHDARSDGRGSHHSTKVDLHCLVKKATNRQRLDCQLQMPESAFQTRPPASQQIK